MAAQSVYAPLIDKGAPGSTNRRVRVNCDTLRLASESPSSSARAACWALFSELKLRCRNMNGSTGACFWSAHEAWLRSESACLPLAAHAGIAQRVLRQRCLLPDRILAQELDDLQPNLVRKVRNPHIPACLLRARWDKKKISICGEVMVGGKELCMLHCGSRVHERHNHCTLRPYILIWDRPNMSISCLDVRCTGLVITVTISRMYTSLVEVYVDEWRKVTRTSLTFGTPAPPLRQQTAVVAARRQRSV
jgi:hypothetical protein